MTDRSDASGTGYWSPITGTYRHELIERAMGSVPRLPAVLGPSASAGVTAPLSGLTRAGVHIGPGAGDNAAAQFNRPNRSSTTKDWPALLRLLERRGVDYAG